MGRIDFILRPLLLFAYKATGSLSLSSSTRKEEDALIAIEIFCRFSFVYYLRRWMKGDCDLVKRCEIPSNKNEYFKAI